MTLVMESIALDDPLRPVIQEKMTAIVGRGRIRPTVARVAFSDENGPKGGVDIRCAVTVELPRRPTIHASHVAETARQAFDGAVETLGRELQSDQQRNRSIRIERLADIGPRGLGIELVPHSEQGRSLQRVLSKRAPLPRAP